MSDENLISRSQAKRLLARLTSLNSSFTDVDSIGSTFVGEILGVLTSQCLDIKLGSINMSEHVIEKMIRRTITSTKA